MSKNIEGELKKQIQMVCWANAIGSQKKILFAEASKVLDEAKADFPKWLPPAHAHSQYPNSDELSQALISHSIKVGTWFEKWFGKST